MLLFYFRTVFVGKSEKMVFRHSVEKCYGSQNLLAKSVLKVKILPPV